MRIVSKVLSFVLLAWFVITCNQKGETKQTILQGELKLLVDESLLPIVEDQVEVFESQYNARITLDPKSEAEVIQTLAKDTARVAILARNLTKEELNVFKSKKISPRITKFASDGIALIANKGRKDTIIALQDVVEMMQQKQVPGISGLVFDNPNSSTAQYMSQLASVQALPAEGVFSFNSNIETVKYVAANDGMIGVVGLNWVYNPRRAVAPFVERIHILGIRDKAGDISFPSQNDIAEGRYPLARDLFIVNCQGFSGLGMGFASFIAGETGQRIVLKSGLVPAKTPGRKILIRQGIEKK